MAPVPGVLDYTPGMNEQVPYTVVRAFPHFDVRRYPECVLVQVHVDAALTRAAAVGLRPLHGYLAGGNRAATTFPHTAPVLQVPVPSSGHLVSLVLAVGTDPAALPQPLDDAVRIRAIPSHEAAVLRFGGWTTTRFLDRGRRLLDEVRASRLEPLGGLYFARFDSPWTPRIRSRNEALVRVTSA